MGEDVDAGQRREQLPHGGAAGDGAEHAGRQDPGEDLPEAGSEVGAAFARLVHHGVAGDDRRAQQARGHGHGVVPGGEGDDDAARLRDRVVGREHAAAQAVAPVHRAELGVLVECADPCHDPAQGLLDGLAGLAGVERGELLGVGGQAVGGRAQGLPAFLGSGPGPVPGGGAGGLDRGPHLLLRGGGQGADRGPVPRILHGQLGRRGGGGCSGGHGTPSPCGRASSGRAGADTQGAVLMSILMNGSGAATVAGPGRRTRGACPLFRRGAARPPAAPAVGAAVSSREEVA